ncbi:AMP-binding protein [Leucobacter celer]|uniref:AMP-binding protein n=2 Tax=Leucobacter TaxID=55968 RepID=UPI0006A7C407|nr:AMP-binding protein [Leucobacter celer]
MIEATWHGPHASRVADARGSTIPQRFREAVESDPDREFVIDGTHRLTLAGLAVEAARWQERLSARGIGIGSLVSIQLPNWWETLAVTYAAWGIGATVNLLTPIYRDRDLQVLFEMQPPDAVVAPAEHRGTDHAAMIAGVLRRSSIEAVVLAVRSGEAEPRDPGPASAADYRVAAGSPDDVCLLMYTSGTTGRPKGVLHTHRSLLVEAQSIAEVFSLSGERVFMPSPVTHVTGLLYGMIMPVLTAGGVVLLDRWVPETARRLIEADRCAITVAATPFLRGLADAYREAGTPSALRHFLCGGAEIPAALIAEAERAMGTEVSRTYGSTEFPTLCTVHPGAAPEIRHRTDGTVIGAARARIAGGAAVGTGELEVAGPEMFAGYLDATDNEDAFTADGWFRTGDLASLGADGSVTIVGRVKDLIIRGGENISAKEVEDLLLQFAEVRDVAVVGYPDEVMGERVCAVVVSSDPDLRLARVLRGLTELGIAMQKIPEALLLVDELPRTASGKVPKFEVRARVRAELWSGAVETRIPPQTTFPDRHPDVTNE